MTPPERQMSISFTLPAAMLTKARRRRLEGTTGTVLMLGAGYYLQREAARAFRGHDWKVVTVNVKPEEAYIQSLLEAILFEKPDFIFTVNHLGFDEGGFVANLIEQTALPAVSWFVDSPAYILLNHLKAVSPWIMTPVWERMEIPYLRDIGFEEPFWLALGADPDLMGKGVAAQKNGMAGFVGDSMEEASAKWRKLIPGERTTEELFGKAVEIISADRSSHPLLGEIPAGWDVVTRLNFASAVVLEATRRYRQEFLKSLSDKPLKIWGDDGWKNIPEFGAIIASRVDYYRELPAIYGSNSINVNFTSFQMPTAVNQRIFDVPAAGGLLVTDDQSDLQELFRSEEVVTFSSIDELKSRVEYFLRHPARGEQISRRALQRILREHTYYHRIGTILAEVKKRYSCKRANPPVAV